MLLTSARTLLSLFMCPHLFLQGDNQQKTVFDRRNSLPVDKAFNPVQEREEGRAKTAAGFELMNPGS